MPKEIGWSLAQKKLIGTLRANIRKLGGENRELRRLVSDFYRLMALALVPLVNAPKWREGMEDIERRMDEFGIERFR